MCKCDYGNCSLECATVPLCKCHISSYTEEAKAEREWWHNKLKELKCVCTRRHSHLCVRKAARRLLEERPV